MSSKQKSGQKEGLNSSAGHNELNEIVKQNLIKQLRRELEHEIRNDLREELYVDLKNEVRNELRKELRRKLEHEVRNDLRKELRRKLEHEVRNDLLEELRVKLEDEVRNDLNDELRRKLEHKVRNDLREELSVKLEGEVKEELRVELKKVVERDMRGIFIDEWKTLQTTAKQFAALHKKYSQILTDLFDGKSFELEVLIRATLATLCQTRELSHQRNGGHFNECGFKALIISLLLTAVEVTSTTLNITSERRVKKRDKKNGFIDLLLVRGDKSIVLELKYITRDYVRVVGDDTQVSSWEVGGMGGPPYYQSIQHWLTHWMNKQALKYAKGVRFENNSKQRVSAWVICGHGNSVSCKFSK